MKAILPKLDEEKNCIICFKLFNFEQLLRIEYKFKEIFGFIIYQAEFDIVDYLDELMTKEEEEEDSS